MGKLVKGVFGAKKTVRGFCDRDHLSMEVKVIFPYLFMLVKCVCFLLNG